MTYLSSYKVALQYFTHCKKLLNSAITAINKVQGFFQFKIFTVDNDIDVQVAQMPIPGLSATRWRHQSRSNGNSYLVERKFNMEPEKKEMDGL